MTKKEYSKPEMKVVELAHRQQLLAGSATLNMYRHSEDFVDDEEIL